ncbi:MAG: hypothetical protein HOM58_07940 [Rhodospirillaceae bacterium]|nr:hypothetical protein [Rhodospirillaceae bacterium]MBT5457265.1 hypothetical protein [Rhodospirillaceae bacterium]
MTGKDKEQLPFLMASLKEVQDTVRAYDLKSQIVGVGYIFAINIIFNLGSGISNTPEMNAVMVTAAWLVFIFPIALFGAVLYPSRKMAPKLGEQGSHALRTFYVQPERIHDVDAYLADVDASDVKKELAYEILRTAGLREIKRRRFLRALWVAAMSFMILFFGQLLRAGNFFTSGQ